MFTLEDIFQQATEHHGTGRLDTTISEARLFNGYKITKYRDTGKITIQFIGGVSDYYNHVNDRLFLQKGWVIGCYLLSSARYTEKIQRIDKAIRKEVNSRNNPKTITGLQSYRDIIIGKYNIISLKLKT